MKNWAEILERCRRGIDEAIIHLRESPSDSPTSNAASSSTEESLYCCCASAAVAKP